MTAALALKFEVATLLPLQHEKLVAVPLLFVFDLEYFCKRLLARPLHLDPLNLSTFRRQGNILVSINIILYLLDISIRRPRLNSLAINPVSDRRLEPICDFENIP